MHRHNMDKLPSFLQVPEQLGIDNQALGSATHPSLYPARQTELLNHNVKRILHTPALKPTNKMKREKYKQPKINIQV